MGCKVQIFWEGHKNLRNLPRGFDIYLVNVKTMRKIAQIFMAFSEKLNFTYLDIWDDYSLHDEIIGEQKLKLCSLCALH